MGFQGRARRACIVLALLLPLAADLAPVDANPTGAAAATVRTHEGHYRGRYRDDPRFDSTFGDLEVAVGRALRIIEDRLGIEPGGGPRIHVYVLDADTKRFGHDRARCCTHRVGADEYHHVDG